MPELTESEALLPAARRSKTLTVVVVTLLVLPFVASFPSHQLMLLWIQPQLHATVLACLRTDCPAALDLERRGLALELGPSLLVAMISILLGAIGLIRMRWYPPSRKHIGLFAASLIGGVMWVFLLGLAWEIFVNTLIYL